MKIFLVNPSEKSFLNDAGDRVPLGLGYLVSYNRAKFPQHQFKIYDLNHTDHNVFLNEVLKEQPDYVGISASSPTLYQAINLNYSIKAISKNTKTIIGGCHPTVHPEATIGTFNHTIMGEGEIGLEELLREDETGKVAYSRRIYDLDSIPFPARDLLDMSKYNMKQNGLRTATLITSRGCVYSCNFCSNDVMGKIFRQRSPENVAAEAKELKEKYGYKALYFVDDNLILRLDFVNKFTPLMKQIGLPYRITARADAITDDKVKQLKDSGCNIISFGVETGNQNQLNICNKKETLEEMLNAAEICRNNNMDFKTFWIVGLPGETPDTIKNTLEFAKKVNSTTSDFYLLVPFPGCEFHKNPAKYGITIKGENY